MTRDEFKDFEEKIYESFMGSQKDKLLLGLRVYASPPSVVREMRRKMVRLGMGSSDHVRTMFDEAVAAFKQFKKETKDGQIIPERRVSLP